MVAAPSSKPAEASKSTTPPASANKTSNILEKGHPGVRRSTPDSEVLASSDDDGEQSQLSRTVGTASKPIRRTSWLNEVPMTLPRKTSLPAPGPLSPASTGTDQSNWATISSPGLNSSVAWSQAGGSSFPWNTGNWNSESRKEPPPRLSELMPSPTISNPSVSSTLAEEILSPTAHTAPGESNIPFSIPLHPTPKTYRSQSYSVGQLDPEFLKLMANKPSSPYATRARNSTQFSALHRRPSRPSVFGDLGHDHAMLDRVREDDDDDDGSGRSSDGSVGYTSNQARTIEQLSRENAMLRQAAGHMDGRYRDRAMSSASVNSGYSVAGAVRNPHRIQGIVPEESFLNVEDLDGVGDIPDYNGIRNHRGRRFSEQSANLERQFPTFASLENRTLENVKKAHWQTSLGFGSIADIPQSRRHSFADVPLRHASLSSSGDSQTVANPRSSLGELDEGYFGEVPLSQVQGQNQPYFGAREQGLCATDAPSGLSTALHQAYAMPTTYGHQHQHSGLARSRPNQLLYIVTFKCHRADVFYIQEDTGLQVKPGDLVIVEADRGTDLGTVAHANITLQKARELKQQYAEEHYKWLMMFSRQGQNGASNAVSPSGGIPGLNNRSTIGGMGSHGPHGIQEMATDIKPKLIKRLAQNHEILTLRDKEGNEAKAKRVCQQKVVEHRLNMEILDAEFQMDWKKLTFYYFADTYINFNSLVTDLFKIYKTRIWMSAINPASFVTPLAAGGLYGQEIQAGRRHQHDRRAYGSDRDPASIDPSRDGVTSPTMGFLHSAYADNTYQPFGPASRQTNDLGVVNAFAPSSSSSQLSQLDPYAPYSPPPNNHAYGRVDPGPGSGYLDAGLGFDGLAGTPRVSPAQGDWVNRFQGLSLGS